jgi:hypothetical protein
MQHPVITTALGQTAQSADGGGIESLLMRMALEPRTIIVLDLAAPNATPPRSIGRCQRRVCPTSVHFVRSLLMTSLHFAPVQLSFRTPRFLWHQECNPSPSFCNNAEWFLASSVDGNIYFWKTWSSWFKVYNFLLDFFSFPGLYTCTTQWNC